MFDIQQNDANFIANTYARFPLTLINGKGSIAVDENGKEYIDLGSGIGVTSFGYCDNEWVNAVCEQAKTLQHTSNLYFTEPCVKLAKALCEKTGFKRVFFSNSGAEANECAIKTARKYAQDKKGEGYFNIITLQNSFHGRTITTLAATGQEHYHKYFQPLTNGFLHSPANDFAALKDLVSNNKTAAIIMECVQGEGGVIPISKSFAQQVYNLCRENDILLIIDEVQTGNGRTGKMYAYEHFDIFPDIITTAKGLGGGLPIGAAILGDRVENVLGFGDHGSTYGGNPVACAGALSIINRLNDDFLNEVTKKSEFIFNELNNAKGIIGISGLGLMIGIETERPALDIVKECISEGVLCLTAKNKVRLLPALNIEFNTLSKAIKIIKQVCAR